MNGKLAEGGPSLWFRGRIHAMSCEPRRLMAGAFDDIARAPGKRSTGPRI
ncbi:MAG: hypothetical protein WA900_14155 [Casimicrobiaceae bacterium]